MVSSKLDRLDKSSLDRILGNTIWPCTVCLCGQCVRCPVNDDDPHCDGCQYVPQCTEDYYVARCEHFENRDQWRIIKQL